MDEKRKFFRIKNKGEMQARIDNNLLEVVDLSAASAAIKTDIELPQSGSIELKINMFVSNFNYDLLFRRDNNVNILVFNDENQIEKLLSVLKNLRKEQNS